MAGVHAGQWGKCVLAALGLLLIAVPRAEAFEALDGRIQAHGFLEMQIRSLSGDFSQELDLAQWYNVINVELEFDILPDGWGPFDLLSAYVRVEGRFDCIYYDACGIFPSARTYGNKSRNLPLRLRDAFDEDYAGVIESNAEANPPGLLKRVPDEGDQARDPTGWTVVEIKKLPRTEEGELQENGIDYDPRLDNADALNPPYANSYCPTNGLRGTNPELPAVAPGESGPGPIGCYTNRPEAFEIQKRRGFPGFDTIFDINGADGELGPNPDYWLADPDGTVNEMRALGAAATTQDYERVMRGLAIERDDPAYYTFAIKVDTDIIRGVDVNAIDPADYAGDPAALQDLAQHIVYGESGDPEDPDCVGGFCEPIRDAGQLYTIDDVFDWKFTFRAKEGPAGGTGRTVLLGPWLPKNFFTNLAAASDRANPFRGRETPTNLSIAPIGDATPRSVGQRYHILDVASGLFDPTADCDTGVCTYGADPIDPRLLKYEQLLIAAGADDVLIGGHKPSVGNQRDWFGAYPNKFLAEKVSLPSAPTRFEATFGGDFSGIVPKYNTFTSRPTFGDALKATPFIEQIAYSDTPGYNSVAFEETIAYTNIDVTGGLGELPMRVAPDRSNLSKLDPLQAQGLYIPSRGLMDTLASEDFDHHEFNIKKIDRAFNHGASQNDTYELKEAYLDMEFLDSRLWVRAGIQNIVWGKTELFRTTDQFNPQDLAMASLPGLEESRIGLLSARAVYSFYDVGPLEDVRLELAANFDRIKPADLGACGEPYTIDVVCGAAFGLAIHSLAGIGLAGVDRPPNGWDDIKGIEFGGRIEFRWDRFSFAITDFYGYNDLPYPDPIFFYERNIDPNTGRMRKAGATGPCENAAGFQATVFATNRILHAGNARLEFIEGDATAAPTGGGTPNTTVDDYSRRREAYTAMGIGIDEACLKPGGAPGGPNENRYDPSKAPPDPTVFPNGYATANALPDPDTYIFQTLGQWGLQGSSEDFALAYHPANQQFFAALCSATITVAVSLTPGACGFNIFGSPTPLIPIEGVNTVPFSEYFSILTASEIDEKLQNDVGWRLIIQNTKANRDARGFIPATPANRDTRDGLVTAGNSFVLQGGSPTSPGNFLTIDSTLTSEQKALLGCGPFFGTRCDSGAAQVLFPGTVIETTLFGEGGGIDVLNAEASAILQSFPGIEGTDRGVIPRWVKIGQDPEFTEPPDLSDPPKNENREEVWVDTWTTWSDNAQPGTIGFEGGEYCTRYAPDSPYANEVGIVRLPGCRGAESTTVNDDAGTIDVVFEPFYTPKQDGCIFSEVITARDGTPYAVRAVNEDGSTDGEAARINSDLAETCFNPNPFQVSLHSTTRWTPEFNPADPADCPEGDAGAACRQAITDTWPYVGSTQSVLGSRTLFHPLGSCESAGVDMSGDYQTWVGNPDVEYANPSRDYGFPCDFRLRDFDADFIEGNAQIFRNEVANWSWNMLMFLMVTSCNSVSGGDDLEDPDCFDPELAWDTTRCSFSTPQFCRNVKSFLAVGATNRNHVLAGGNARFGRRDFIWHSGGEAVLRYARRNVFGFSMDFAEDVSKTNWGLEFTWFGDRPFINNNSMSYITDSQTLNLTISVDRPTFINFLNANRTFFFNTQWFFQYLLDYDKGFASATGPFNVLFTFAFFTGYFQDRLLPQMVTVYDFRSQSGGFLPSIQYRFNERFSVTFGISYFIGRGQFVPMPLRGLAPVTNRAGGHAYEDGTEFFISNIRHRDEAYLRIRWTF